MADTPVPQAKPEPNEELVKVFDSEQESEGMVVQGLLETAGIATDLRGIDAAQNTYPIGGVEILVRHEDADEAEKIIESYRQSPLDDDETAEITGPTQPPE
jgi:hypothetical protein